MECRRAILCAPTVCCQLNWLNGVYRIFFYWRSEPMLAGSVAEYYYTVFLFFVCILCCLHLKLKRNFRLYCEFLLQIIVIYMNIGLDSTSHKLRGRFPKSFCKRNLLSSMVVSNFPVRLLLVSSFSSSSSLGERNCFISLLMLIQMLLIWIPDLSTAVTWFCSKSQSSSILWKENLLVSP